MRLWKKISIFLIYPLLMLAAGFLASIKLQDFFYPSREQPQIIQEETAAQEQGSLEAAELCGKEPGFSGFQPDGGGTSDSGTVYRHGQGGVSVSNGQLRDGAVFK